MNCVFPFQPQIYKYHKISGILTQIANYSFSLNKVIAHFQMTFQKAPYHSCNKSTTTKSNIHHMQNKGFFKQKCIFIQNYIIPFIILYWNKQLPIKVGQRQLSQIVNSVLSIPVKDLYYYLLDILINLDSFENKNDWFGEKLKKVNQKQHKAVNLCYM